MSIILEALKKVEKDKSRKRRKKNIAEAILQPHDSRPARSKVLLISCIVFSAAVLLGTGAGITYFLSAKGEPVKPAPAATPDVAQTAAVSKPPVAAAEKPAEAAAAPPKPARPEAAPPAMASAPVAVEKPPATRELRRQPEKAMRSRKAPAEDSVREEATPMKIDGIIWAEERERRRALVNGSAVKEGDTVDGVRVERIESNRIRFSKNGKTFGLSFR